MGWPKYSNNEKNEFINENNYWNDDDNSQNYRKYLQEC